MPRVNGAKGQRDVTFGLNETLAASTRPEYPTVHFPRINIYTKKSVTVGGGRYKRSVLGPRLKSGQKLNALSGLARSI